MRAFIAFKLPEGVTASLGSLQSRLRQYGLNLRWVRPENIHLTLKFLGNVDPDRRESLAAVLRQVSGNHQGLSLQAKGLGVFPTIRKARVLWSGVHGDTDRLHDFHDDLEHALAAEGFEPEKRSFRGHLTLGRVKGRIRPQQLAGAIESNGSFSSSPFSAERVTLFRSELKPSGAEYTEIAGADLTGMPPGVGNDLN
ncbi:MAG: RNA 2',3'-cyclic phosphodiesterase [Deltaproteobacteria bacterium]|nr:RNA 2',3'-cyclic phosphodiesterase [Deltaproteobacteria bacterium]